MTRSYYFCLVFILLFVSCARKETKLAWDVNLPVIGSQSSPRTTDLNGDGVLDIVMGACKNEYQATERGVLAIDGETGEVLWQVQADDQVFGSATFYDITGDGTEDVFIGGRLAFLKAIDGKSGEVIWAYRYQYENDSILKNARFNFYSSVLVPDQNDDGAPDLLIQNGGNQKAAPYTGENRFPGVLMLFNLKTGDIIAADTMPDGKESYMSALCFAQPGSEEFLIVFGTGGETISGNLYLAGLSEFVNDNLSNAKVIATENGHGFIAPPVLTDLNMDGHYDIVAISHSSNIYAINGQDFSQIWQTKITNTESSNSFAVGYFTDDDVPDLFTFVSQGQWPNSTGSIQVMIDGSNGEIAFMDSIGCTGFSSPVVYDLDRDGRDEAIISINEFDCSIGFVVRTQSTIQSKLLAVDFSKGSTYTIDQLAEFKNIFSTPWIGDLDSDGYLDIIHCQYYSPPSHLLNFLGMRVRRISTSIRVRKAPVWGAYMGSNGDGVFPIR